MTAAHHRRHRRLAIARGQGGPVDHDHRQAQGPRGVQLGARAATPGILCHDQRDAMALHQRAVLFGIERTTGNFHSAVGQGQRRVRRIDQPHKVMVLWPVGKGVKMLAPDSQKDPFPPGRQKVGGGIKVGHHGPAVAGAGFPRGPFQRDQRYAGVGTGGNGIAADVCGKGVGRVDHTPDGVVAQVLRQTCRPAEPADACGQGLGTRAGGAPGIGQDRRDARRRHGGGKLAGLGRAAKDQGPRDGGLGHG